MEPVHLCGDRSWAFVRYASLEDGYDIHTIQELLGHRDVKTTIIYTRVLNRGGKRSYNPMDRL